MVHLSYIIQKPEQLIDSILINYYLLRSRTGKTIEYILVDVTSPSTDVGDILDETKQIIHSEIPTISKEIRNQLAKDFSGKYDWTDIKKPDSVDNYLIVAIYTNEGTMAYSLVSNLQSLPEKYVARVVVGKEVIFNNKIIYIPRNLFLAERLKYNVIEELRKKYNPEKIILIDDQGERVLDPEIEELIDSVRPDKKQVVMRKGVLSLTNEQLDKIEETYESFDIVPYYRGKPPKEGQVFYPRALPKKEGPFFVDGEIPLDQIVQQFEHNIITLKTDINPKHSAFPKFLFGIIDDYPTVTQIKNNKGEVLWKRPPSKSRTRSFQKYCKYKAKYLRLKSEILPKN